MTLLALDLVALAVQVAGVLHADLDLFGDLGIGHGRAERRHLHECGVVQFRALDQVQHVGFAADRYPQRGLHLAAERIARGRPQRTQARGFLCHGVLLGLECRPAAVIDQAQLAADAGQAHVGVVLAQLQPVFGAAGEHAVRLVGAVGDQVVDQYAQIRFVAARAPASLLAGETRGIEAGQQALRGGFFIAGGAVDLAGEEQAADGLGLQRVLQPARIEEVVFDRIARAGDVRVLEATHAADQRQLHIERQRGGDAVGIDLDHVQPFGLDEDLVAGLLGEAHHLVLDGGAVARADALDLAAVQRRAVQRVADDLVGTLAGMGDPAADLRRMLGRAAQEGHHRARVVTGLFFHQAVVQRAAVDARRRAGLQAIDHERALAQARGQRGRRRVAHAASGVLGLTDVDLAGQEGAGGQHHGGRAEAQAGLGDRPAYGIAFDDQVIDGRLEHGEVGLGLDDLADRHPVEIAVGLAAGGAHGRALGGVEGAPLDAGAVGGMRHRAAQGIDLLDQMALADPADGRVAAHRADGLDVVGQQQGARTAACGRQRGLGAGVAAADDDHVVAVEGVSHGGGARDGAGRPGSALQAGRGWRF